MVKGEEGRERERERGGDREREKGRSGERLCSCTSYVHVSLTHVYICCHLPPSLCV